MKTRVLVLAALLGAACGGNKSTWQLRVKTPPGEDLFGMGVTQVRLTVGDQVQTNPVSSGRFDLAVTIQEPKQDQYVNLVLEALDASGQVVARGKSPNVVLTVNSDNTAVTSVTVFVARVGKASATGVALLGDDMKTPQGRLDLAERVPITRARVAADAGLLSQLGDGTSALALQDLAAAMIVLSENSATNILIDRLGLVAIGARLRALGLPRGLIVTGFDSPAFSQAFYFGHPTLSTFDLRCRRELGYSVGELEPIDDHHVAFLPSAEVDRPGYDDPLDV